MAGQIARRLAAARRAAVVLRYQQRGHGVFGPPYPAGDRMEKEWGSLGGTAVSNRQARADGWPKVVAFLNRSVGGRPAPTAGRPADARRP